MDEIATVGDLIAALADFDEDTPIRLATQPGWPFEYTVGAVAHAHAPHADHFSEGGEVPTVWIGVGEQTRYLPGTAVGALGWSSVHHGRP